MTRQPQILIVAHDPDCAALIGRGEFCQAEIRVLTVGPEIEESEIPSVRNQVQFRQPPPEAQPVCAILESLGLLGKRRGKQ